MRVKISFSATVDSDDLDNIKRQFNIASARAIREYFGELENVTNFDFRIDNEDEEDLPFMRLNVVFFADIDEEDLVDPNHELTTQSARAIRNIYPELTDVTNFVLEEDPLEDDWDEDDWEDDYEEDSLEDDEEDDDDWEE